MCFYSDTSDRGGQNIRRFISHLFCGQTTIGINYILLFCELNSIFHGFSQLFQGSRDVTS